MIVSLNWLKKYVDIPVDTETLVHDLTMLGLNVEHHTGTGLDEPLVVVGHVLEADRHPDADRLTVCRVDVGQGDGCLLVTPNDKHVVIDAGVNDNMYRYLRWRYGGFEKPWRFESGLISHPDQDHYAGFEDVFDDPNVTLSPTKA